MEVQTGYGKPATAICIRDRTNERGGGGSWIDSV
jgi:hypothetical protein